MLSETIQKSNSLTGTTFEKIFSYESILSIEMSYIERRSSKIKRFRRSCNCNKFFFLNYYYITGGHQFEENDLTMLVQKYDWKKLTSFSHLPHCSSFTFVKILIWIVFTKRAREKMSKVYIFQVFEAAERSKSLHLSKDVFE